MQKEKMNMLWGNFRQSEEFEVHAPVLESIRLSTPIMLFFLHSKIELNVHSSKLSCLYQTKIKGKVGIVFYSSVHDRNRY